MAFRDRTPLYYYSQSSECRHVNNDRLQLEIFTIQISIIKYITPNKTAPFTEQFLVFLFIFCAHFYLIIARKNSLMKRNWGLLSRFEIPNVPSLNFKCVLVREAFHGGDKTKFHFQNQISVVIYRLEIWSLYNVFYRIRTIQNLFRVRSFCFPSMFWKLMPSARRADLTKHWDRCKTSYI